MNRKKWKSEEKLAVVLEMFNGKRSVAQICKEYGVAENMAYRWKSEAIEAMKAKLSDKRNPKNRDDSDRERLIKIIGEQACLLELQKKISTMI